LPRTRGYQGDRGRRNVQQVGKRRTLGKDSPLGYPINLKEIDLSQLIGGKHFTVPCTVSQNGYRVNSTALINTGVNGFAFINTAYIINVAKFLNIKATLLEKPVQVKGYNGQASKPVTHILKLHISLNR